MLHRREPSTEKPATRSRGAALRATGPRATSDASSCGSSPHHPASDRARGRSSLPQAQRSAPAPRPHRSAQRPPSAEAGPPPREATRGPLPLTVFFAATIVAACR